MIVHLYIGEVKHAVYVAWEPREPIRNQYFSGITEDRGGLKIDRSLQSITQFNKGPQRDMHMFLLWFYCLHKPSLRYKACPWTCTWAKCIVGFSDTELWWG